MNILKGTRVSNLQERKFLTYIFKVEEETVAYIPKFWPFGDSKFEKPLNVQGPSLRLKEHFKIVTLSGSKINADDDVLLI